MDFGLLREKIIAEHDLDINLLEQSRIERVIKDHLTATGSPSLTKYITQLTGDPEEYNKLLRELLAPPDRFFADKKLISVLEKEVLPEIIDAKGSDQQIRIWIPGCGKGYIAYELAMLLQRLLGTRAKEPRVHLIATDTCQDTINQASMQRFPREQLEQLALEGWPIDRMGQRYRIESSVRRLVTFGVQDPVVQPPYTRMDLVLAIGYLPLIDRADRERVKSKFVHALAAEGLLMLGRGEIVGFDDETPKQESPFPIFRKHLDHPFENAVTNELQSHNKELELANQELRRTIEAHECAVIEARQREQEFKSLIENSPDIVARFDRGLRHLYVNPVIERITGIPAHQFIGKTNTEIGMPDHLVTLWTDCTRKAFEKGEEQTAEFAYQGINRQINFQIRFIPEFKEDGRAETVLAIARDITEIKQSEQALRQALERQRRIADTLQQALIPPMDKQIDGLQLAARYEAAFEEAEVGGDFYHSSQLPGRLYLVVLGDVSGKGLEAAVFGSMARHMMLGFVSETPAPDTILTRLNDALSAYSSEGRFVTLAYALIDITSHIVHYSSAGHEPAIHFSAATGQCTLLEPTGRALGVTTGVQYNTVDIHLRHGDLLVFYTDGLSDAGPVDEPLGTQGLMRVVIEHAAGEPAAILDAIYEKAARISGGRLRDDAASIVMKSLW